MASCGDVDSNASRHVHENAERPLRSTFGRKFPGRRWFQPRCNRCCRHAIDASRIQRCCAATLSRASGIAINRPQTDSIGRKTEQTYVRIAPATLFRLCKTIPHRRPREDESSTNENALASSMYTRFEVASFVHDVPSPPNSFANLVRR